MSTFTLHDLTNMLSFSMSLTFCAYNQYTAMDGTIPSEVGKITSLKTLELGSNSFVGSIPTEIGLLTNLQGLYLWVSCFIDDDDLTPTL